MARIIRTFRVYDINGNYIRTCKSLIEVVKKTQLVHRGYVQTNKDHSITVNDRKIGYFEINERKEKI